LCQRSGCPNASRGSL